MFGRRPRYKHTARRAQQTYMRYALVHLLYACVCTSCIDLRSFTLRMCACLCALYVYLLCPIYIVCTTRVPNLSVYQIVTSAAARSRETKDGRDIAQHTYKHVPFGGHEEEVSCRRSSRRRGTARRPLLDSIGVLPHSVPCAALTASYVAVSRTHSAVPVAIGIPLDTGKYGVSARAGTDELEIECRLGLAGTARDPSREAVIASKALSPSQVA